MDFTVSEKRAFSRLRRLSFPPGRRLNLHYALTKEILTYISSFQTAMYISTCSYKYRFRVFDVSPSVVSPGAPIKFTVLFNKVDSVMHFVFRSHSIVFAFFAPPPSGVSPGSLFKFTVPFNKRARMIPPMLNPTVDFYGIAKIAFSCFRGCDVGRFFRAKPIKFTVRFTKWPPIRYTRC